MHRLPSGPALRALLLLTLVTGAAACDDDPARPDDGPGPKPDVVSAEVIDIAGPIFRSLRVALEEEGAIEVFYRPTEGGRVFRMTSDSLAIVHDVLMPRLRQGTAYEFAVRSFNEEGPSDSIARGEFSTDSLPAALLTLEHSVTGTATFPLVMVPFRTGAFTGQVAFEPDGEIVWYFAAGTGTLVAAPVPDSHDMVFIQNGFPSEAPGNGLLRVSPWREVVAELPRTAASPFGQIHHDMTALDDESVLFIAFDTMTVRDTVVYGEALWQWNTVTGALDKRWSSWDFIDWDTERNPSASPTQWLHANSVTVGPRGNYVVSFRSLSQVISIAPDFQSLEWRIGGPGATVALSTEDRFVGQHAATEVAGNRLLLFDNQGGGEPNDRSRTIELQIEGDTAFVVAHYTPEPPLVSPVRGGTYRLPSGNTLTSFASFPFALHETTPDGTVVWSLTGDLSFTNVFRVAPWSSIAGEVEVDAMP